MKKQIPNRSPDFTLFDKSFNIGGKIYPEVRYDFYIKEMVYVIDKKSVKNLQDKNGNLFMSSSPVSLEAQSNYDKIITSNK